MTISFNLRNKKEAHTRKDTKSLLGILSCKKLSLVINNIIPRRLESLVIISAIGRAWSRNELLSATARDSFTQYKKEAKGGILPENDIWLFAASRPLEGRVDGFAASQEFCNNSCGLAPYQKIYDI